MGEKRKRTSVRVVGAALLAAGLCVGTAHSAGDGSDFTIQPADFFYEIATDGALSDVAAPTNDLAWGHCDDDGRPDLVNFTEKGLQIFRNVEGDDGCPDFTLIQEIPELNPCGGCFVDWDGDEAADDIVYGTVDEVKVAIKGPSGYTVETIVEHEFGVTTIAKAFPVRRVIFDQSVVEELCIVVAPCSSFVNGDNLGENPGLLPIPYFLERVENEWVAAFAGSPTNAHGIDIEDREPDSFDIFPIVAIANRDTFSGNPIDLYVVDIGFNDGLKSVTDSTFFATFGDNSALFFDFGYSPCLDFANKQIAWGSWNRASVKPFLGAPPTLVDVPLDPDFVQGGSPAEVFAVKFADWNCDGCNDLVIVGRDSAPVIVSLTGDNTDPINRLIGENPAGVTYAMAIANFASDTLDAPDLVVGGNLGLTLYKNDKAPPPPPVPPTAEELLQEALACLADVLDPFNDPVIFGGAVRNDLSLAQYNIISMNPEFLSLGTVTGDQIAKLGSVLTKIENAKSRVSSAIAGLPTFLEPAYLAKLQEIELALCDAAADVCQQFLDAGGVKGPTPAKPSRATAKNDRLQRRAQRLFDRGMELRNEAVETTDVRKRSRLLAKAMKRFKRTGRFAGKGLSALLAAGLIPQD